MVKNNKAFFNYEMIEDYVSGIVLVGSEVKSIRLNNVSFVDSYCVFISGELWLKNLHVTEYKIPNRFIESYDEKRDRKLLLTKRELKKLESKVKQNSLSIIPTKLYFDERGLIKVNISLCRGKKTYDKKESIKKKDIERDIKRDIKRELK